ncbi:hypothetical protein LINGRAHAP2_LOCUS14177 [Linum grandiflorum]
MTTTYISGLWGPVGSKGSPVLGRWITGLRLLNTAGTTSSCIVLLCARLARFSVRMLGFMWMNMARRGLLLLMIIMSLLLLSS